MSEKNLPAMIAPASALCEQIGTIYTSLDVSTDEGKDHFMACMGDCDLSSNDVLNLPFEVEHLLSHDVYMEDKDGEVERATRTVLILANGQTLGFVSKGVKTSLAYFIGLYGAPPWKPARKFILKSKPLGDGKHIYTLKPAK